MRVRFPCLSAAEGERGQSTVEYVLVFFAFTATIVVLGVMWRSVRDGSLLRLCIESLSHGLTLSGGLGSSQDVVLY